ncbi:MULTISPECIES: hypothetical protein [unclassified Streptomyces]|uniref:hypothetical protein n=1 Tax=unclassified Streptomyces TaxID=2593676 RepID=UPI00344E34F1
MKNTRISVIALLVVLVVGAGVATAQEGGRGTSGARRALQVTYTEIVGPSVSVPPGEDRSTAAFCPPGTSPTGGGGEFESNPLQTHLSSTEADINSWTVTGANLGSVPVDLHAFVVCATG